MEELNPDHYKYMPEGLRPEVEKPVEEETQEEASEEISVEVPKDLPKDLPEEFRKKIAEEIRGMTIMDAGVSVISPERLSSPEEERTGGNIFEEGWWSLIYGLLSPFTIPTIVTLFIFFFSILSVAAPGAVLPYSLTVLGATCFVPLIVIYILLRVGHIESLQMYHKSERIIPYAIEFLALGAMAIFFVAKGAPAWIWTMFCGGAAIAIVNLAVNFGMRISSHCSAMAALVAALIVIEQYGIPQTPLFWWIVGSVFFAGLTGTLAIIRGRHTLAEVLAGYATGFLGIILFSLIH